MKNKKVQYGYPTVKYLTNDGYTSLDAFFKNYSIGADSYSWDFGDGQLSTLEEPVHTYEAISLSPISYTITLYAYSLAPGCVDKYDTTIVIEESLYIPNVITPNDDSYNEYFTVKGIKEGIWKFTVYNRWGTEVFNSDHYQNDWDGDHVPTGVYYYELSNPSNDRNFKGWLQILR